MLIPVTVGTTSVLIDARRGIVPALMNATRRAYSPEIIAAFIVAECYRKDSDKLERLVKRQRVISKVEKAFESGRTTHLCVSDKGLMGLRNEYQIALKDYCMSNPLIIMEYDGYCNKYDIEYITQTLINNIVNNKLKLN